MLLQFPIPTSVELAGWLACAMAIIVALNHVLKLVDRIKQKPPAGELLLSAQQINDRVAAMERIREKDLINIADRRQEINVQILALRETRETDVRDASIKREKIFLEIQTVRREVDGKIQGVYQRIERLDQTVNENLRQIPSEILATLRNSGALK